MADGIDVRHSKSCSTRDGAGCDCTPTYQAHVFDSRSGKRIRKTFPTKSGARVWRQDALVAVRKGTMVASGPKTVQQAADDWIDGARRGEIRNRSGDPYKPSAVRAYDQQLRLRILPAIGGRRFTDVRRHELQDLLDKLAASGLSASTVQCAMLPLRAMYRRAMSRGEVAINPTTGLEVPAVRGGRDRIASPTEGAALLAALPSTDRAVWATAMYAGLRRGELRGLRWEDVDLATGKLRVERGWDDLEGPIEPKSREGKRTVPIAAALRDHLIEHRMSSGRSEGLVFGIDGRRPFDPSKLTERARRAWGWERAADDKWIAGESGALAPITLHECRHTFASLMIAAGVNAKALSTYMGHFSISITLDKYGHLMPGSEDEAAGLLDAFLASATAEAARTAEPSTVAPTVAR
jgi:integrase